MACTGRYAAAWEYAAFWCVSALFTGTDTSGGGPNAFLTDGTADFPNWGIGAGVGMVAYNVTEGTHGPITAVTQNTLTATGVTWSDGDVWRVVTLTENQIAVIEQYLDITANNIHASLASVGACDCSLSAFAEEYLKKINIIETGAFHQCPCAKAPISDDMRRLFLEWSDRQLELIRTGKIELCAGHTGADWPSVDWFSQSLTDRSAAEIIANAIRRGAY